MIALFMLTVGVLLVSLLFHTSQQHYRTVEQRWLASQLADKILNEVRDWSRSPANFDSDWAPWRGVSLSRPDYPGFDVQVDCQPAGQVLYSPCTALEQPHGVRAKTLDRSVVPVRVEVLRDNQSLVTAMTLVGTPPRPLSSVPFVEVTPTSAVTPLGPGQQAEFEARLLDGSGRPIPDVVFNWYIVPITGNAVTSPLSYTRRGLRMAVENSFFLPNGTPAVVPGEIGVRAIARYRGQILMNGAANDPPLQTLNIVP